MAFLTAHPSLDKLGYRVVYLHIIKSHKTFIYLHIKTNTMTTSFNAFGETVIKWSNNIHPDNPNFQQVVNWTIWVKKDGSVLVGYNLGSGGKTKFMYNLTKDEAIAKFS